MKNYDVPSAGSDGNYGAPTPHAANVNHMPFTAPEADLNNIQGWEMVEADHNWTSTPGEAMEGPPMSSGGGWSEVT